MPKWKVVSISIDPNREYAVARLSDGSQINVIVLELTYGPNGTWARLVPANDPTYVIAVTQSGKMPSETYIIKETPFIPEELPDITQEQLVALQEEVSSPSEPV